MFRIEVETVFSAAHAIVIRGVREPLHGHDWRVTATLEGDALDTDGLLVDFHAVESSLREIVGRWHNANLNDAEAFRETNPTAERVAERIALELRPTLAPGVRLVAVRTTEAVGCAATWLA